MRRSFLSLVALAIFSAVVHAADPVVVVPTPEPTKWVELTADVGDLITLTCPGATDKATWTLVDDGATIRPCGTGKECSFAAKRPGRYRLLVTTSTDTHKVAVTVGPPQPMPPTPVPPGPVPVDPLVAKFQAAYTIDAATTKAEQLRALVILYDEAIKLVGGQTPPVTTGDLAARLRQSATQLGVTGLEGIRRAIAEEMRSVFPADAPLTEDTKVKALTVLTRVRDSLKAVK